MAQTPRKLRQGGGLCFALSAASLCMTTRTAAGRGVRSTGTCGPKNLGRLTAEAAVTTQFLLETKSPLLPKPGRNGAPTVQGLRSKVQGPRSEVRGEKPNLQTCSAIMVCNVGWVRASVVPCRRNGSASLLLSN